MEKAAQYLSLIQDAARNLSATSHTHTHTLIRIHIHTNTQTYIHIHSQAARDPPLIQDAARDSNVAATQVFSRVQTGGRRTEVTLRGGRAAVASRHFSES